MGSNKIVVLQESILKKSALPSAPDLDESLHISDLSLDNIRQNKVGRLIERQKPRYRDLDFNKREYHSFTRGWILNEICRRADSHGRTIGEIFESEICASLRDANCDADEDDTDDDNAVLDAFIGLSEDQISRVFPMENLSLGYFFA